MTNTSRYTSTEGRLPETLSVSSGVSPIRSQCRNRIARIFSVRHFVADGGAAFNTLPPDWLTGAKQIFPSAAAKTVVYPWDRPGFELASQQLGLLIASVICKRRQLIIVEDDALLDVFVTSRHVVYF